MVDSNVRSALKYADSLNAEITSLGLPRIHTCRVLVTSRTFSEIVRQRSHSGPSVPSELGLLCGMIRPRLYIRLEQLLTRTFSYITTLIYTVTQKSMFMNQPWIMLRPFYPHTAPCTLAECGSPLFAYPPLDPLPAPASSVHRPVLVLAS